MKIPRPDPKQVPPRAARPGLRMPVPLVGGGHAEAQAAKLAEMADRMTGAMGDLNKLLDQLAPRVIAVETHQLDANGTATRQFRVPFAGLGVDYFGTTTLTVAAAPLAQFAPGPGPGVAKVGPGGFAVANMRAYQYSLYGLPGELVTVTAYGKPQEANGVVSPSAAPQEVIAATPAAGAQFTYTVPAGGPVQNLISVRAQFVTDAVVQNRFLSLQVFDAAFNQLAAVNNNATVVASSTVTLNWLATVTAFQPNANGNAIMPLPFSRLEPGWQVKLNAAGIDPGDQWSQIALVLSS